MKQNKVEQMRILFEVYRKECDHEIIKYTDSEIRDGHLQSWIVMDGIELSYMMYQGEYQPIFMCNRYTKKYGDTTYYFKNYEDCAMVWHMNEEDIEKYL
jgi:hypothetical protein